MVGAQQQARARSLRTRVHAPTPHTHAYEHTLTQKRTQARTHACTHVHALTWVYRSFKNGSAWSIVRTSSSAATALADLAAAAAAAGAAASAASAASRALLSPAGGRAAAAVRASGEGWRPRAWAAWAAARRTRALQPCKAPGLSCAWSPAQPAVCAPASWLPSAPSPSPLSASAASLLAAASLPASRIPRANALVGGGGTMPCTGTAQHSSLQASTVQGVHQGSAPSGARRLRKGAHAVSHGLQRCAPALPPEPPGASGGLSGARP